MLFCESTKYMLQTEFNLQILRMLQVNTPLELNLKYSTSEGDLFMMLRFIVPLLAGL